MKRGPTWSYGILLVMVGTMLGLFGLVQALVVPISFGNWFLAWLGLGCCSCGAFIAWRAATPVDRSLSANERRLPRAQLHRSARR